MTYQYPKSKNHDPILISLLLGLGITLLIFLLVPLTQLRHMPPPPSTETIQALIPAVLPPPSDLPPPPPYPSEPSRESVPKWEVPQPLPQLQPLDLSLHPGLGGDWTIDDGLSVDLQLKSPSEWISHYAFDELDTIPQIKRRGHIQYPIQLQRRRVEGFVQLLVFIDPSGRVEVQEVLDYSHQAFVAPATAGASATRFTPPTRKGQAVSAQYSWTIQFLLGQL